jgi:hypothetical protein
MEINAQSWIHHLVVIMNEFVMKEKVRGSGKQKHEERKNERANTSTSNPSKQWFYKHAG